MMLAEPNEIPRGTALDRLFSASSRAMIPMLRPRNMDSVLRLFDLRRYRFVFLRELIALH